MTKLYRGFSRRDSFGGFPPSPQKMYFAYILKSLKDNKYYYGSTGDIKSRLKQHNYGKVRSTKSRIPLVLHYSEQFEKKSDALKRELFFKSIEGYIWLKENNII